MRHTDHDELMSKYVSAALALSSIAAFMWENRNSRSIEGTQWLDGECIRMEIVGVHPIAPGANPVLPMEKSGRRREAQPLDRRAHV